MGKVVNRVAPEMGAVQRPGRGRRRVKGRGKGRGPRWAKGLLIRRISEESPISNIKDESDRSKDDLREIQWDPIDDRSQGWKVQGLPRRSEDRVVIQLDLRYESIILRLSLDLVSWWAIPGCAHEREHYRWANSEDQSCVSLDWCCCEREEGVDDVGRREASLVTSAMSGSAISDRCTVT